MYTEIKCGNSDIVGVEYCLCSLQKSPIDVVSSTVNYSELSDDDKIIYDNFTKVFTKNNILVLTDHFKYSIFRITNDDVSDLFVETTLDSFSESDITKLNNFLLLINKYIYI